MSNQNSTTPTFVIPPLAQFERFSALAQRCEAVRWGKAQEYLEGKAEDFLKAHEARLFCAAAERALIAYDVPFVSSARDNVRPEQIVRL